MSELVQRWLNERALDVQSNPFFHRLTLLKWGPVFVWADDLSDSKKKTLTWSWMGATSSGNEIIQALNQVVQWANARKYERLVGPLPPPWGVPLVGQTLKLGSVALGREWKLCDQYHDYELQKEQVTLDDVLIAQTDKLKALYGIEWQVLDHACWNQYREKVAKWFEENHSSEFGSHTFLAPEQEWLMRHLKHVLDPGLSLLMKVRGEPAGFAFVGPEMPWSIWKGLHWKLARLNPLRGRKLGAFCVFELSIDSKYFGQGLEAVFLVELIRRGVPLGYQKLKIARVSSSRMSLLKGLEKLKATKISDLPIYERELNGGPAT